VPVTWEPLIEMSNPTVHLETSTGRYDLSWDEAMKYLRYWVRFGSTLDRISDALWAEQ